MVSAIKQILDYRELLAVLARKNIVLRYKQAYLGIAWAVLKPLMLMVIFTMVRAFVGIESGDIPYPLLTFAALMPWIFFQESTSQAVTSVVANASLIRKIYFPRVIFPLTVVITKLVEFGISAMVLALMMVYYDFMPSAQALWVPLILVYTICVSLAVSLAGSALNVYYRDVASALPVILSIVMYLSPVIYPLDLVQRKLLENQAAGAWSDTLYTIYTLNPLAGIIDAFQRVLLKALPPDWSTVLPGLCVTLVVLPFSYSFFKRAESHFADVI
jgi:lipopolysaccharide transport system permease protein